MEPQEKLTLFSNLQVFYEIAKDSFEKSEEHLAKNRKPKPDGGYIITYDPQRQSFKHSLISVSFADSYVDLYIRLAYIIQNNQVPPNNWDRYKSNKEKLESLGISDQEFLDSLETFRIARNDIAHEKPIIIGQQYSPNSTSGTGQDIAKLGMNIIEALNRLLPL